MSETTKKSLTLTALLAALLNGLAAAVDFIFCVPLLGRFLKLAWNTILSLIQIIFGLLEHAIGYRPTKIMRLGVLILKDEQGNPLTTPEKVYPAVIRAGVIFEQAGIKIEPAFAPMRMLPEGGTLPESAKWIRTVAKASAKPMLDVSCDARTALEDLTMTGYHYQVNMIRSFFSTSFRRVFGIGAPITVFVVRDIKDKAGCSLTFFTDYVTLKAANPICLAHEVGHACNLPHVKDKASGNLMYPICKYDKLTPWQIILMRSSRHVSYL